MLSSLVQLGSLAVLAAAAAEKPPNILWIMSDDLGYGELSSYGQRNFSTPNLDQLAKEGIRFKYGYAGAPVCAPSRCALMTGLHLGHAYIRGNNVNADGTDMALRESDMTVAQLLQDAGYFTALVGKWGLGYNASTGQPNRKGFDYYFGEIDQKAAHNMYPPFLWLNTDTIAMPGNVPSASEPPPSRDRCTAWGGGGCNWTHAAFTDVTLDVLQNRAEAVDNKPFFLYLSWTDPHAGGWTTDYNETGNPVPWAGCFAREDDWPIVERDHASVIQNFQDRDVGRILSTLDRLGFSNSTVIFFASDNGASNEGGSDEFGFHDYKFFDSSGGLRGCKRSLYEGGIRTPAIIRWPGVAPAGVTSDFPWYFPDFLPTALAIAQRYDLVDQLDVPVDGISILPTLRGRAQKRTDQCMYFEFCTSGLWGQAAVLHGSDKGYFKAVRLSSQEVFELYELKTDPSESVDVSASHPMILSILEHCIQSQHTDSPDFPAGDAACSSS